MVFVKSITRYLLRVPSPLEKRTERVATGRNCRGTNKGKIRKAKDRKKMDQLVSAQNTRKASDKKKGGKKFIKKFVLESHKILLVNKFNLLLS